jgi:hypothetical protein
MCDECPRKVYSDDVSIVAIAGTPTLVIDVPSQVFHNGSKGCIVITQNIPEDATISMPVAISIGGVTTTVYPVVDCNCNTVTAPMLRTRRRYPFRVSVTGTTATFKILKNLSCAAVNNLATIPASVAAGG